MPQIWTIRQFNIDTIPSLLHKQTACNMINLYPHGLPLHLHIKTLIAGLIWLLLSTAPSLADLRVCNATQNEVSVAVGYRSDNGWQSEGWWVTQPEQCIPIVKGTLGRYYYIYAVDDISGGSWSGRFFMCTRDDPFTIFGVRDCLARGYERSGFFEIDTAEKSDWTVQLVDATQTLNLEQ